MLIRPNTIMGRTTGRNMVVKKLLAKYNVNLDLEDKAIRSDATIMSS